ncbi:MAG: YlmH/Sll1252 family protein [Lachnospiraceae bacterium]|nr:YlmH/Sll1252 family protein [Lachnospiraceae bacterium]
MNKEELMLRKRLVDLSNQAYQRDIVMFSDFLNLNELNILHTTPKDQFSTRYETFGGYDTAERQMVAFLPDALCYDYFYPMKTVIIEPLNAKFSETLSHRDYLGSLMNLGIERSRMGDIIIDGMKAIVFVKPEIADFITENLTRIRHTTVKTSIQEVTEISYEAKYEQIKGTVASIRLDTVLSLAYPMSRSKLTAYIEAGKVFVNGKLITSNGYHLKEGDFISVRGLGRIMYEETLAMTKKNRCMVTVRKFI